MRSALSLTWAVALVGCAPAGAPPSDSSESSEDAGPAAGGDASVVEPGDGGRAPDGASATADERCDDGVDNDGDGDIDESCSCAPGATQDCHPDSAVAGVGQCAWGTQTCDASEFGGWSACSGAVLPAEESCGDGVDNDCDGLVDCDDEEDCEICRGSCELVHDYDIELVDAIDGASLIEPCGPGCADLWVGRIGDNYWSGSCSIFEEHARVMVDAPSAILSATLERAKWDDYMQIYLNDTKVWSGPDGNFPPETGGACELSTSWDTVPGTDLTGYFRVRGEIRFKIRVSVTGGGEGYARIRLRYDVESLVTDRGWSPEECVEAARAIAEGECEGTISCTDGPDASGCVDVGGARVCEDEVADSFETPPAPELSTLCRRAQVEVTDC